MRTLFTFLLIGFTTTMFAQSRIEHYKHTVIARTTDTEVMRTVNDSNDTTYLLTYRDGTYSYLNKYNSVAMDREELQDFYISLSAILADMGGEAEIITVNNIRIRKFKFMDIVHIGIYDKTNSYVWLLRNKANKFAAMLKKELWPSLD